MDAKIIICGCTKNSGRYILGHLAKLVHFGKLFSAFKILFYENDSIDSTVAMFQLFKKACPDFEYISETGIEARYAGPHNRVRIIAHGRNALLDTIQKNYSNYDLVVMVDLDDVLTNFDFAKIAEQISKYYSDTRWAALTTNCDGPYYDIWALRMPRDLWVPDIHGKIWDLPLEHDCWSQIRDNVPPRACIKSYQKIIPADMPLIETESSFNGLGVYRLQSILECRYNAFDLNGGGHCEHVTFHKEIRKNGGRIFICPSLLINCQREHIQR